MTLSARVGIVRISTYVEKEAKGCILEFLSARAWGQGLVGTERGRNNHA